MALIGALGPGCASAPRPAPPPDDPLRAAVAAALAADERTSGLEITVAVDQGVVHLSGLVPSAEAVRDALDVAGEVDGVRGLVNRLRIIASGAAEVSLGGASTVP